MGTVWHPWTGLRRWRRWATLTGTMDPELDVIANGPERGVARSRTRPTKKWRSARLRWAGPVAAVLLLVAVAVFAATRPDAGREPVAAPSTKTTTNPIKAPPSLVAGPIPAPDNRPETTAPMPLYKEAVRALGPAGQGVPVETIELIGSDYRRGQATLGVFGHQISGTVNVDLVCVGTGTTLVWIQDQTGESVSGPPARLDCANPEPARLTGTVNGYSVYASPDPHTVAVLAYVATVTVEIG